MSGISDTRRWTLVGLLFAASFINYLDRATISVALPALSADLSLSPSSKGLLLSSFFWSYALMQIPMGWLVDRLKLRWLYAACFLLWSAACALTGLVGSFATLVGLRIMLGIGESIYLPGSTKFVSETFPSHERGLPSGIFDCGTRAGLAVGASLIAFLVSKFGWRAMFMIVGSTATVWVFPWLIAFPSKFEPAHRRVDRKARTAVESTTHITFNRNLLGASLGFLCFGYFGYLLVTWLPDYLVEVRHLTILRAGIFASIPFVVWTVAEPFGGLIADRLIQHGWDETRVRKGIVGIAFVTGLLLLPALLVARISTAIALIAGASMVGLAAGNLLVFFQACAPPEEVGQWTGIGNFAGNIGGILSPLITGLLISRTGSYLPGFALAPIVLLVGLLCYWFVVGELKPPQAVTVTGKVQHGSYC
jgi:MFS transporter, ACS family, D-galactonate transporter